MAFRVGIVGLGMAVTPHAKSLLDLANRVTVAAAYSPSAARREDNENRLLGLDPAEQKQSRTQPPLRFQKRHVTVITSSPTVSPLATYLLTWLIAG